MHRNLRLQFCFPIATALPQALSRFISQTWLHFCFWRSSCGSAIILYDDSFLTYCRGPLTQGGRLWRCDGLSRTQMQKKEAGDNTKSTKTRSFFQQAADSGRENRQGTGNNPRLRKQAGRKQEAIGQGTPESLRTKDA